MKKAARAICKKEKDAKDGWGVKKGGMQGRDTVKPRYNAPAFNKIPPIEHKYFSPKKYFHSYLYIGNNENLGIEYNFDESLEIRFSGV